MGITPDASRVRAQLAKAVEWASSERPVPDEWFTWAERVSASPCRTYTAALGTGLLARAVSGKIDALALKETSGPAGYSARSLCHQYLVPTSREHGFDLGSTGSEPLNNQPFFRFDRIDAFQRERVSPRCRPAWQQTAEALRLANALGNEDALGALAAFIRQRMAAARAATPMRVGLAARRLAQLQSASLILLTTDAEEGKRAQAFVAGLLDLVFPSPLAVRTRRVNDPSRTYPGDVQVLDQRALCVLSVEVRAKPVQAHDVVAFAAELSRASVPKGLVAALAIGQTPLDQGELLRQATRTDGATVAVVESLPELLLDALTWTRTDPLLLLAELPDRVAVRLRELEVRPETLSLWFRLVSDSPVSASEDGSERLPGF